jgi:hypothetical protein
MAGELVGNGPESKSPPSLLFSGREMEPTGTVGRNGAGGRMTGCGWRKKGGREGEEEIDICSGWRRMEKGEREWKRSRDWLTADLRQGPQLALQSAAEHHPPSSLQHWPCSEVPALAWSQERQARRVSQGRCVQRTSTSSSISTPRTRAVQGPSPRPFHCGAKKQGQSWSVRFNTLSTYGLSTPYPYAVDTAREH